MARPGGLLQLSRWEREPAPPNPRAPELIGAAVAKLAEPIYSSG